MFDPSNYAFNIYAVPTFLTSFGIFFIGLVVLTREGFSLVSGMFFLLALAAGIWLFSYSWMYATTLDRNALAWAKAGHMGITFIPATVYHFSAAVLRIEQRHKIPVFIAWILCGLFGVSVWTTEAFIAGVQSYWWGFYPLYGWLSALFVIFFFSVMIGILALFWKELQNTVYGRHHVRINSFMGGFGIAYIASFDYLAAYGVPVYPFGYIPIFICLLMVAYTIWRYRLVDLTPVFAASQILEAMQGAVLVVDNTGIIRGVNPATCSMLGYQEEEMLGVPVEEIVRSSNIKKISDGRILMHKMISPGTMVWIGKNNRKIDVAVSTSKVPDQNGFLIGEVYVAVDITEQTQADEKTRASNSLEAF